MWDANGLDGPRKSGSPALHRMGFLTRTGGDACSLFRYFMVFPNTPSDEAQLRRRLFLPKNRCGSGGAPKEGRQGSALVVAFVSLAFAGIVPGVLATVLG